MWWMWILAALVCGIVEVMAVSFVFLMLAIGALAAGIAGALGASLAVQMIIFVVVAVALLFVVRPFLKGRVERSTPDVRTNADALIGRTGYVTEIVGERNGRIQFSGGEWSARTEGPSIPVGVEVRVERIDGATAVVSALNPTDGGPTNPYAGHVS
ncbi:NfeD family protein [Actinomyces bouchesdurhonensis]|uniref:NfeD family protein n=1 Tax=Actinomyces bouchesdurhonensis TaxID=1852361 RepID=UPI003C777760